MWIPPKPSLHIWSNTSTWAGGDSTDHGSNFQHIWTEREKGNYINFLELRAAGLALSKLESTGKVVQLYLDNITAIILIRRLEVTCIQKKLTILPSMLLAFKVHMEANFLRRQSLLR